MATFRTPDERTPDEPDPDLGPAPDGRACVVIVDADRRVRQSLADLLSVAGIPVAGAAGGAREALALLDGVRPLVLLVDPRLPDVDAGEALVAAALDLDPHLRVILMGWSDGRETRGVLAQAHGYLPKAADPERFVATALAALQCEPVR